MSSYFLAVFLVFAGFSEDVVIFSVEAALVNRDFNRLALFL
jgi:hypothetical protein